MSVSHWFYTLVPRENMTMGRLNETFKAMRNNRFWHLPSNFMRDPFQEIPADIDSLSIELDEIELMMWVEYVDESGRIPEESFTIPRSLALLSLNIEDDGFYSDPDEALAIKEFFRGVFSGMGGLFTTYLGDVGTFPDFMKANWGLILFSRELVDVLGVGRLEEIGEVTEFEGGYQLAFAHLWLEDPPEARDVLGGIESDKKYALFIDELLERAVQLKMDN